MIAIILGGGAGSRLYPLTQRRSKPAVPLAGKYRLIDVPISNCINSGVTRIFVLTQFNSASLNRHISQTYRFDRFRDGFVNILAAEQTPFSADWFQGTADAVRQSALHHEMYRYDHVLILSGDQLYAMDYRTMLTHHEESGADLTIATIPVREHEAPGFGIMKTDAGGVITEFHEKPDRDLVPSLSSPVSPEMERQGRNYLASMGIYIFSKGVLKSVLDVHSDSNDFGKEIIPRSIRSIRVVSFPFEGYWSDIGTIRSFYEANLMLARRQPPFDMYNAVMPLYTNARMLPPAKFENAHVEESLIAEAAVLSNCEVRNSVIGLRSYIGSNSIIRNTVMMGSDYFPWHDPDIRPTTDGPELPGIGNDTIVEGAIIDRNVCIGNQCRISNSEQISEYDGERYFIRDGIIVIPKNASLPNGTII